MKVFAGTSGFSYKGWKGAFYPDDLKNSEMLGYYATRLPAVEVNNTFYRLPKPELLATWSESVPDGFQFILKASRRITHFKRLNEAEEVTGYLIETARKLADRLGVILFQLPPNFRKDLDRLVGFLKILPEDLRFAFEFRHDEWFDDEVFDVLADAGVALCVADTEERPATIVGTADFGYLRLRKEGYGSDELDAWAKRIREQNWHNAYVMFKHEDEASGPLMAEAFLRRFGQETA